MSNSSFTIQLITELVTEPVTLQEAKDYLRISNNYEDALISELITSARERLEGFTNRAFGEKEYKVRFEYVDGWVELPYSPIIDVLSVENDAGDTLDYEIKGLEVKELFCSADNGVIVNYTCGYVNLPKALKEAILKEVSTSYENRENYVIGDSVNALSNSAQQLARRYSRNTMLGLGF
jgi:uncharacterized phiE125 gp8 family phage protein